VAEQTTVWLLALTTVVLLGGGLLVGAVWVLGVERRQALQEVHELRLDLAATDEYIDDLVDTMNRLRDFVADVYGEDGAAQVAARTAEPATEEIPTAAVDAAPATRPAATAIDAGHEELVLRELGGTTFQFRAREGQR
jgi:hypothetical protein